MCGQSEVGVLLLPLETDEADIHADVLKGCDGRSGESTMADTEAQVGIYVDLVLENCACRKHAPSSI